VTRALIHGTRTCAQLHSHVAALSSFPARIGRENWAGEEPVARVGESCTCAAISSAPRSNLPLPPRALPLPLPPVEEEVASLVLVLSSVGVWPPWKPDGLLGAAAPSLCSGAVLWVG
jgi:hypothetical protein